MEPTIHYITLPKENVNTMLVRLNALLLIHRNKDDIAICVFLDPMRDSTTSGSKNNPSVNLAGGKACGSTSTVISAVSELSFLNDIVKHRFAFLRNMPRSPDNNPCGFKPCNA